MIRCTKLDDDSGAFKCIYYLLIIVNLIKDEDPHSTHNAQASREMCEPHEIKV